MNKQKPESLTHNIEGNLEVHSIFLTIQGEGPFTGQRAVFIRLAGCNLQCQMCDTDYTSKRKLLSVKEILEKVKQLTGKSFAYLVVITGGEPFRQNLKPLINRLISSGYRIQIETNGTYYQSLPYSKIHIVCSPKTGSINHKLQPHIAAYKYVIDANNISETDGLPTSVLGLQNHKIARPPTGYSGPIYIQPADERNERKNNQNTKAAVSVVMKYGYSLQLQLHKIVGVE